jgi:hypothetical protein
VDHRLGAAAVPISQAIHPRSSSRVTLKDINTSTSINVSINSSIKYSSLSSSSSTAITTIKGETSISGRAARHLAFLPQQPTRTIRQPQRKEEAVDVSTVGNKVTGQLIARTRSLWMFPVESHAAKVLFDTGATHSFVSTSWLEAHNIPVEPMIPPLRVNSVGGKVQSDKMYPNLRIEIRG